MSRGAEINYLQTSTPYTIESSIGSGHQEDWVRLSGHRYVKRIRGNGIGFSVLSLDGGGYRGYASLLILKRILRLVQPDGLIFPYLYFDLICGTSTGGLIAILLAVLHLDIDTAIEVYRQLGHTLFANPWRKTRFWLQDAQFNHKLLRNAISEVLARYGRRRRFMNEQKYDRGCKCFVTVAYCEQQNARVIAVSSYQDQAVPDGYRWTILDAALSTSAAPTYFKPHHIQRGEQRFTFSDAGAHGKNNPADLAWEECKNLDCDSYSYFVSIGTGAKAQSFKGDKTNHGKVHRTIANMFNPHRRAAALARGFARYATDVTAVEHRMEERKRDAPDFPYFRFNPSDLGDIDLADHTATAAMEFIVDQYFEDQRSLFDLCVTTMKKAPPQTETVEVAESSRSWLGYFFSRTRHIWA